MRKAAGMVAASSGLRLVGFRTTNSDLIVTVLAIAAGNIPKTTSPTFTFFTLSPLAITSPTHSQPNETGPFRTLGNMPRAVSTSRKFSPTAFTRIETSSLPGSMASLAAKYKLSIEPGVDWLSR